MLEYSINGGAVPTTVLGRVMWRRDGCRTLPAFTSRAHTNTVEADFSPHQRCCGRVRPEQHHHGGVHLLRRLLNYTLTLVLDDYGSETAWTLGVGPNPLAPVRAGGTNGEEVTVDFCLEEGCYLFRSTSSYEDGMCCDFGDELQSIDPNLSLSCQERR